MKIFSTYSVKIKHYRRIFQETLSVYRASVDFLIDVCITEWDRIEGTEGNHVRQQLVERMCHKTNGNPSPKYGNFDRKFYKFPSYLRRSAISEALGMVSAYQSSRKNWEGSTPETRGRHPSYPRAGRVCPCMYKKAMYQQTGTCEAKLKVYIRNTWDWLTVDLRKSDMDYIHRWCGDRKQCAPTLQKRGREWFLDFPFEEQVSLSETEISERTIAAVDLGMNSAATVSVMRSDGTVLGRHFCRLPREYDSLNHAVNRIKKAQQNGNRKTPRLWAIAKGINDRIAVRTAAFIMDVAAGYGADVVVFEHLDRKGRKRGSKKQSLHIWRSQYVQAMVTDKAHRKGMRVSRICAWGTSRLAYDGSGPVERGQEAGLRSYSLCRFKTGKIYNCDLSASYNIGSRYFVREIMKSLPERERLALEAKVPEAARRSTCTLSTLINLNAELMALAA